MSEKKDMPAIRNMFVFLLQHGLSKKDCFAFQELLKEYRDKIADISVDVFIKMLKEKNNHEN